MQLKTTFKVLCATIGLFMATGLQAANKVGDTTSGNLKFDLYDDNTAVVFSNDINATSVTIPEQVNYNSANYNVTEIGKKAFIDCTKLTSVTIPDGLLTIGEEAFNGCTALTAIVMPNSITNLGQTAFITCTALASITLSDKLTTIPSSVFAGCISLQAITIPEGVTSIGIGSFFGCKGLKSIVLPNSVTTIGKMGFRGCEAMTSASLGSGVTSISDQAFASCKILQEIRVMNPVPPVCGKEDCFSTTSATLKIPLGSKEAYKAAEIWKNFTNQKECYADGTLACFVTVSQTGYGTIAVNDRIVANDTLRAGTKVVFKITNKTGGTITKVKLNSAQVTDKLVDNTYTVDAINGNTKFDVEFENTAFDVTTVYNESEGSVKINNEAVSTLSVSKGGKVDFTVTPKNGFEVKQVLANNKDVTPELKENVYTIANLTEEVVLKVTFAVVNSVGEVNGEEIRIYTESNRIVIENIFENEAVSISNIAGQYVYTGTDRVITLNKGVYIVKTDKTIQKVIVK